MTHGGNGSLCAFDEEYEERDLLKHFVDGKCPSLQGKPKIFFVHTSRKDANNNHVASAQTLQVNGVGNYADTLIMHSTQPDARELLEENGSWFTQALGTELKECKRQQKGGDLFDILININHRFREQQHLQSDNNTKRQFPSFTSTLSKTFLLRRKN